MNPNEIITEQNINGKTLEIVQDHCYLGTIISKDGSRRKEMDNRIKEVRGICNEIIQICKFTDIRGIRLRYVTLLMKACLDSIVKFGCGLWEIPTEADKILINKIKVDLVKNVLEVPKSTPSIAIQYEFGINDLHLEILMEKVIMAVEVYQKGDSRIAKQLMDKLMYKEVPGFCIEIKEAIHILQIQSFEELCKIIKIRDYLKEKIIKLQEKIILQKMLVGSKTDAVLFNQYKYDGKTKKYITELDFEDARIIFIFRYRMFPTRANYPGRWSNMYCNICGQTDNDEHLFSCPGYIDLIPEDVHYKMFFALDEKKETLEKAAKCLKRIMDRMEIIQNDI